MRMGLGSLGRYGDLLHIAFGGGICLAAMYFLISLVPAGIRILLFNIGYAGLLAFTEATNAMVLLMLGTVYLPSGFLGGLYTGYKINENIKIILLFPAMIGFAGLIALRFFTGYLNLSIINLQNEIFIPILGNVVGAYLGGYTMNWEMEETVKLSETIELDSSQIRS